MSVTPVIDVVSDANVALKWFHAEGEEDVRSARRLLAAHRDRELALYVLELTRYELGNALLRGRARVTPAKVATVLDALSEVCHAIVPTAEDLRTALELADEYDLTVYDAAYAAVARRRGAHLATFDKQLLASGLGRSPAQLLAEIADHGQAK